MSNPCLAELQITIFFAADSSAPSTHHLSGNVLLQPPVQLTVSPIPSTFLHKNKRKKTRSRRYATAPPSNISITLNSLAAFQHSHPPCQLVIFGQTHTRTHILFSEVVQGRTCPNHTEHLLPDLALLLRMVFQLASLAVQYLLDHNSPACE